MNNGIDDPKKAKNNVLAVVPSISLPIFIPDINSSFGFSFLLFSCNSYNAEDNNRYSNIRGNKTLLKAITNVEY